MYYFRTRVLKDVEALFAIIFFNCFTSDFFSTAHTHKSTYSFCSYGESSTMKINIQKLDYIKLSLQKWNSSSLLIAPSGFLSSSLIPVVDLSLACPGLHILGTGRSTELRCSLQAPSAEEEYGGPQYARNRTSVLWRGSLVFLVMHKQEKARNFREMSKMKSWWSWCVHMRMVGHVSGRKKHPSENVGHVHIKHLLSTWEKHHTA